MRMWRTSRMKNDYLAFFQWECRLCTCLPAIYRSTVAFLILSREFFICFSFVTLQCYFFLSFVYYLLLVRKINHKSIGKQINRTAVIFQRLSSWPDGQMRISVYTIIHWVAIIEGKTQHFSRWTPIPNAYFFCNYISLLSYHLLFPWIQFVEFEFECENISGALHAYIEWIHCIDLSGVLTLSAISVAHLRSDFSGSSPCFGLCSLWRTGKAKFHERYWSFDECYALAWRRCHGMRTHISICFLFIFI